MKITLSQLRRIIKEEVSRVVESGPIPDDYALEAETPREYIRGGSVGTKLKKKTEPSKEELDYVKSLADENGVTGSSWRSFLSWFKSIEPRYATEEGVMKVLLASGNGSSVRSDFDSGSYSSPDQRDRY